MVKFQLWADAIDEIEEGLIQWVELYEECVIKLSCLLFFSLICICQCCKYYYQYEKARLPACTLLIHGLLHVAAKIWFCRPVWTSWTFAMEGCCGQLQSALSSCCFPWSN
ncbi:hypothetical protein PAXRUDRAFT_163896 [Paxillus rubicundulus Ve08.2h10]|uniref:Unplaced genomic scaffold scaffold_1752, whole genome shotgun sequence n=1 Tax=Paxillus rubicundulus Ve08.2h10 TaxID=930991 RepID=A0A0D0C5U9_9AGAM|nr:hypothetical protein PAXRUDRAFT_163896 [Paxillus rubicundulus Ve08.2h10]